VPAPSDAGAPATTVYSGNRCAYSAHAAGTVNPAQTKVLRQRSANLQVVAGPPGTGKTQMIIILIASAVCDGHTVLFISKNNVYDVFMREQLFPGILHLGSQEAHQPSIAQVRKVLNGLNQGLPGPENRATFEANGIAGDDPPPPQN